MSSIGIIESILFVASKPIKLSKLQKTLNVNTEEFDAMINALERQYNTNDSGIHVMIHADQIQMRTNPDHAEYIKTFVKNDLDGDLTKAQLETLTVIAYQGPITRPELEEIRGVNCAVILRNLLMRGLITVQQDADKVLPGYVLSFEALGALGIENVSELPKYEEMHAHPHVTAKQEIAEE